MKTATETKKYFKEILKYDKSISKDSKLTESIYINSLPLRTKPVDSKVKIYVVDDDSLEVARLLILKGNSRPLVLNLASDRQPGGTWLRGGSAQEESLFLRSTYDLSLNLNTVKYPLAINQVVWSPGVFVFKDKNFQLLDWSECFKVDFLAVAGIRHPRLTEKGHLSLADKLLTERKILSIFQIAEEKKYEHLILSALGCGAFRNPPNDIAQIFKDVMERPTTFYSELKSVTFAVLSTTSTKNFRIFKNILIQQKEKER